MQKLALLIGVSEYESGLSPLPSALKDVEALQRVLKHPEMGNFTQVKLLINPDPKIMEEEIEALFSGRNREDLVLLFFSGHGLRDDKGNLYFATRTTRKSTANDFIKASTVPARFIQERMSDSRCQQQILILDCCHSGAIADGLPTKGDHPVDVQTQLGGQGRVVLTSSTETQPSRAGKQGDDLSVYTQYIVEGIETGEGDDDRDGLVSVEELHNYAKRKVQAVTNNAMKPQIYSMREGFNIVIAEALKSDPHAIYREEAERLYQPGKLSFRGTLRRRDRKILQALCCTLSLSAEDATDIEREVLQAQSERQEKLRQFWRIVEPIVDGKQPITPQTRRTLLRLQRILNLRLEDIDPAFADVLNPNSGISANSIKQLRRSRRSRPQSFVLRFLRVGMAVSVGAIATQLLSPTFLPDSLFNSTLNHWCPPSLATPNPSAVHPVASSWQPLDQISVIKHSTNVAAQQMQQTQQYLAALKPAKQAMHHQSQAGKNRKAWQAIAQQWRTASRRMSAIQSGPYAKRAKLKAVEYQHHAAQARKKAQQPP
jgi:Caspase domain